MRAKPKVEFKNIFKPSFLLVFLAIIIATVIEQSLNKQIESLIQSPQGLSNSIWFWGGLSLLTTLIFPLITSLLCAHTLTNRVQPLKEFIGRNFELSLIESLRAWGKIFLWSLLFIVPGLLRYTDYFLTPFVVLFSEKYRLGEVDALAYSKQVSKKFWYRLNFWLFIFYFTLPLLTSSLFDEYTLFQLHPLTATLSVLLETLIYFLFHFLVLKLFLHYLNEFEPSEVENIEDRFLLQHSEHSIS